MVLASPIYIYNMCGMLLQVTLLHVFAEMAQRKAHSDTLPFPHSTQMLDDECIEYIVIEGIKPVFNRIARQKTIIGHDTRNFLPTLKLHKKNSTDQLLAVGHTNCVLVRN